LGAILRDAGGTVDFEGVGGGTGAAATPGGTISIVGTNTSGILGGWATVNTADWASVDSHGNIVPLSANGGYVNDTWATGANVTVTTNSLQAPNATVNSLQFGSNAASFTVTLSGAGLNTISSGGILVSSAVTGASEAIAGGQLSSGNGHDLVVIENDSQGSLQIGSQIVDNGAVNPSAIGLTKSGSGMLILTNSNTYSGGTTINAGTLLINSSVGSATGAGSVMVNTGGALAGIGTVSGPVTVQSGATLAPSRAATIGTLAAASSLNLADGANLSFSLDAPNQPGGSNGNDLITVASALTLNPDIVVNVNEGPHFADGTYQLIHYTGNLVDNSGGFATWNLSVDNNSPPFNTIYSFSVDAAHNNIDLNVQTALTVINLTPGGPPAIMPLRPGGNATIRTAPQANGLPGPTIGPFVVTTPKTVSVFFPQLPHSFQPIFFNNGHVKAQLSAGPVTFNVTTVATNQRFVAVADTPGTFSPGNFPLNNGNTTQDPNEFIKDVMTNNPSDFPAIGVMDLGANPVVPAVYENHITPGVNAELEAQSKSPGASAGKLLTDPNSGIVCIDPFANQFLGNSGINALVVAPLNMSVSQFLNDTLKSNIYGISPFFPDTKLDTSSPQAALAGLSNLVSDLESLYGLTPAQALTDANADLMTLDGAWGSFSVSTLADGEYYVDHWAFIDYDAELAPISFAPEPSSLLLIGAGALGLIARRRQRLRGVAPEKCPAKVY
jgi:autotransporter-associated beta strand protein